jgi:hypothetical protein
MTLLSIGMLALRHAELNLVRPRMIIIPHLITPIQMTQIIITGVNRIVKFVIIQNRLKGYRIPLPLLIVLIWI